MNIFTACLRGLVKGLLALPFTIVAVMLHNLSFNEASQKVLNTYYEF